MQPVKKKKLWWCNISPFTVLHSVYCEAYFNISHVDSSFLCGHRKAVIVSKASVDPGRLKTMSAVKYDVADVIPLESWTCSLHLPPLCNTSVTLFVSRDEPLLRPHFNTQHLHIFFTNSWPLAGNNLIQNVVEMLHAWMDRCVSTCLRLSEGAKETNRGREWVMKRWIGGIMDALFVLSRK